MSAAVVMVTVLVGLLHGTKWRVPGDVLEMDKFRADKLASLDPPLVQIGGKAGSSAAAADESQHSELIDWPGEAALTAAGVVTLDQLRSLIDEHGDAWPKQVKGIGKATAAEIGERLAAAN